MIGQQQHDGDEIPEVNEKRGGLILAEDDLTVGQYVCVYNLKHAPEEGAAIMGQSLKIQAICLPYFVGQLLTDPSQPFITLDCRFLSLMKVSEEFVQAQQAGVKAMQPNPIMQPRKRKQAPPPE
jgi:hypothetical protein